MIGIHKLAHCAYNVLAKQTIPENNKNEPDPSHRSSMTSIREKLKEKHSEIPRTYGAG